MPAGEVVDRLVAATVGSIDSSSQVGIVKHYDES